MSRIGRLLLSASLVLGPTSAFAQDGQGSESLLQDFATALQVSQEEVAPILQKQYEAMQLAQRLRREIPGDFAGMRIIPTRNFSALVYLKSGDAALLSRYTTDPSFKVVKAKRSVNELYAVVEEVRGILNAAGINFGAFFDLNTQDIQVSLPDTRIAGPLLKALEGRGLIRVVKEDITLIPTVMAGESAAIGSYNCTTGFSVEHTDKRKGSLTAGHCPDSAMTVGSTSAISYVAGLLNSTNRRDIQWHAKSGGSFTPEIKVTGGSTLKVNGEAYSVVGAVVCLNGRTSGNRCGKILSLGFSGNSAELTSPTVPIPVADAVVIEASTPGNQMCAEGDSGGPIYSTSYNVQGEAFALGVEFAGLASYQIGTSTPKKFSRCVYAKIEDISMLGLRVITNVP